MVAFDFSFAFWFLTLDPTVLFELFRKFQLQCEKRKKEDEKHKMIGHPPWGKSYLDWGAYNLYCILCKVLSMDIIIIVEWWKQQGLKVLVSQFRFKCTIFEPACCSVSSRIVGNMAASWLKRVQATDFGSLTYFFLATETSEDALDISLWRHINYFLHGRKTCYKSPAG